MNVFLSCSGLAAEVDRARPSMLSARCGWVDRPPGNLPSGNNRNKFKAGLGQKSPSCHGVLGKGKHKLPDGVLICNACRETDEAKPLLQSATDANRLNRLMKRAAISRTDAVLVERLKADLDFVADAAMKAAEDVAKKQTTVDETMGTVLRIQTGGESKRAEEALGNLRRAVAGCGPAVEDDARAHAEAGNRRGWRQQ